MSANQYSPKKWTNDVNDWIIDNLPGLNRQEGYQLFMQQFPDFDVTLVALSNQRSRLGAAEYQCNHKSTRIRPLYSEHIKKGYVFVKVAQPSVWWSKAKWVYVATHPEEVKDLLETDAFYFADGNNRNFDWQNIILVHRREQAVFIGMGGVVPGNPELTKLNLLQARLKLLQLDAGEKLGTVSKIHNTRVFIAERNRKQRERFKKRYYNDPEYRAYCIERARKHRENWTPEQREKASARSRRWAEKNRLKKKGVIDAKD